MPQILFKVQEVKRLQDHHIPNTLEANVEVEFINRENGELLKTGLIPVRFNEHGSFPSISHIQYFEEEKKLQTKLLFDIRRYVRKLRPYLQPDDE
ncbi:hypothetical protein [Pseudalkalibacillus sp. JSM 102089]|uniref:hypothetical protein n=1 Tax=Pseudalkalibacillus sp. JSM 102089 TaxID=3229856 RepID=UPI00352404BA